MSNIKKEKYQENLISFLFELNIHLLDLIQIILVASKTHALKLDYIHQDLYPDRSTNMENKMVMHSINQKIRDYNKELNILIEDFDRKESHIQNKNKTMQTFQFQGDLSKLLLKTHKKLEELFKED